MSYTAESVEVRIINRQISQDPKAIGRTAAVLAAALPYSVEHISITPVQNGLPTTTVTVDRSDLEAQVYRPYAGVQSWETTQIRGALPVLAQVRAGSATSIRCGAGRSFRCRPCRSSAATTASARS